MPVGSILERRGDWWVFLPRESVFFLKEACDRMETRFFDVLI